MFVQHFLKGFLRLSHRCWRLRLLDMQPFHHHIIRQIVLVSRIDGHGLGVEGRGFDRRLGLFLSKAIQLTGIHPAQQRRNLIPAKIQHSQTLFLCVQDFQLHALCRGAVIGNIAGLQIQRLDLMGIGSTQPVSDLTVAPAGLQQRGNLLFIRFIHQSMGQYIPQVLICIVRVNGKKLSIVSIAAVCPKQLLELFFALCPVDGIYHTGGQKLYGVIPQLGDLIGVILDIHGIAHGIDRGGRVIGGSLRSWAANCIIFLIGNGNFGSLLCLGSCNLLCIRHHPLDKRVILQFFRVCHLSVDDSSFPQSFPDGDWVDVVKTVLFFFGIEPVLLNELGNPALYLRPGQLRFLRAAGTDNEQAVTAAVFLSQPCSGIFLSCMVFHVADDSVFTLNIAVPCTKGSINIFLRKRAQKFMELWIGFVDHFPVQTLAELRYIRIKADQLHILRTKDRTAHSSIALDDSIFTVRMTAGIAVCGILGNGGSYHRLILLKLLPKGRLWRFFLHLRLLGLDGIFFGQFLFSLDFVILRLFLFGKIAAFLNKRGNALGNIFPVQVNIWAVLLFIVQSFSVVIFAAVCCARQGMRASANAILVFEESHFFLIRMVFHEESIDTAFSSGKTAAAGHGGVDLILGNEVLDGWHLRKVRRKSPVGQVKVFQVLPDFPWPMVVKAQQVTILLIGSPEGGVFFLEGLTEGRVIQLLRQAAGLLREPIAFDL